MRARHLAPSEASVPEEAPPEDLLEEAPPEDLLEEDGEAVAADEPDTPPIPRELPLVVLLRDQLAEKDEQLRSYIAAYKEARADMDRERSRLARERDRLADSDRMELAGTLLEVLDNLDRSVASAASGGASGDLIEGIDLVRKQFVAALAAMGVERMVSLGETFDAGAHEATGMVPASGDQRDQEVVFEERPGYRYKDKLLRPARVVVASRND